MFVGVMVKLHEEEMEVSDMIFEHIKCRYRVSKFNPRSSSELPSQEMWSNKSRLGVVMIGSGFDGGTPDAGKHGCNHHQHTG